jgi:O-antigen/teichoic acid export membrane protein
VSDTRTTTGRTVLEGGFWFSASRVVPQLYTLVISVAAARFLGPNGMGRQSFIAFTQISLLVLLSNGFFLALMRSVGEALGRDRPAALRSLLRWGWRVQLFSATLGATILIVAAELGAEPRAAWLLAAVVCLIAILHTVPSAVIIGMQLWKQAALVGLTTGVVGTTSTIAVLWAGGGITGMFAVEAAVSCVNLFWTGLIARRAVAFGAEDRLQAAADDAADLRRHVVRFAKFTTLSEALNYVVDRRSEVFFLAAFSTSTQIALYSIVFSMMTAVIQIPVAMATVITPAIATLFGAGAVERIRAGYARALRLLLLAALPLTTVGLAVGPELLHVIYGAEYHGTRPVLLIMMASFPLVPLTGVASALLAGIGRGKVLLQASAAAAAIDIALAGIFVPGHGAVGAAIAAVGGQVVAATLSLWFARRLTGRIRLESQALLRAGVASTAAGVAGWLSVRLIGGGPGLLLGASAAAVTFAISAAALRILPADDAAWLDDAIGPTLGGRVGSFCRLCARPAGVEP